MEEIWEDGMRVSSKNPVGGKVKTSGVRERRGGGCFASWALRPDDRVRNGVMWTNNGEWSEPEGRARCMYPQTPTCTC